MIAYIAILALLVPLLFWLADEREWFALGCAVGLVVILCLLYAQAADAGFDNPLKHATLGQRLEREALPGSRCPELSNPVECGHGKASSGLPRALPRSQYSAEHGCDWLHVMYSYHHPPGDKPSRLKLLHGCSLWRADAAYHIRAERAHLSDPQQELLEELSTLVTDLEGALT